jgi:ketosteroid isomerase-like protein
MSRYTFLLALVAGLCSGQETAGPPHAFDMTAIEQDDAVALPPGEPPVIGIEAIRKWLAKSQADPSTVEVVEYVLDFKEVTIRGDEAVEWGRTRVAIRPRGTTSIVRASGNLMRILKKQADGSWKVFRSAWNVERPVSEKR